MSTAGVNVERVVDNESTAGVNVEIVIDNSDVATTGGNAERVVQ